MTSGEKEVHIDQNIKLDSSSHSLILYSQQGLGKTTLLKDFAKKQSAIYIDLSRLSISPENFAVEFLSVIASKTLKTPLTDLKSLKKTDLPKEAKEIIDKVDNELQKIKPNQELLLSSTFRFPESLNSPTLLLDNFDELLAFNNYAQIKSIQDMFFNFIKKQKIRYILATSRSAIAKSIASRHKIEAAELPPFTADQTTKLVTNIYGKLDSRLCEKIHTLSAGYPIIISALCNSYKKQSDDINAELENISVLFNSLLCDPNNNIFSYCDSLMQTSLARARGATLLKSILKALSQNPNQRLTELARLIYRAPPVAKALLERLIEVDLIEKTNNTFAFKNPVLESWCRLYFTEDRR